MERSGELGMSWTTSRLVLLQQRSMQMSLAVQAAGYELRDGTYSAGRCQGEPLAARLSQDGGCA